MARKKTAHAAPSGQPQGSPAPSDQAAAGAGEVGAPSAAATVSGPTDPPAPAPGTAAASGDSQGPLASPDPADAAATTVAAAASEVGTTIQAATMPGPSEPPVQTPEPDGLKWVKALVLHDSIYGKCGEVREFAGDQVDALRGAGYIDPHPNAVASAGG